jgi:hypothetical protein
VEGVDTNSHVERVLTGNLGDVLVGTDTGSFQSLRGNLLVLIREKVNGQRELIDGGLLSAEIVDTDLGVCYISLAVLVE